VTVFRFGIPQGRPLRQTKLGTASTGVFLLAGQQFPDSKKCREIGTFVGEAS
jgi:hypothetical protein